MPMARAGQGQARRDMMTALSHMYDTVTVVVHYTQRSGGTCARFLTTPTNTASLPLGTGTWAKA